MNPLPTRSTTSPLVQAMRQLRRLTEAGQAGDDALEAVRVALEQADTLLDAGLADETRALATARAGRRGVVLPFRPAAHRPM